MVVQLLLQGMKPARFRDAVKLQLAWEEGDSDSPSKLMTIMNAQLDKFVLSGLYNKILSATDARA